MTHLDADTVALMTRRAYDIAGCTKGVTVHLNGTKLPVSTDCMNAQLPHVIVTAMCLFGMYVYISADHVFVYEYMCVCCVMTFQ